MTAQEAHKILHPDTTLGALAEIRYYAGFSSREKEIKAVGEACLVACEALQKQIPKKVIFENDGEALLCPRCNFDLVGSITEPDHDPYYCFECGQALDWSVE